MGRGDRADAEGALRRSRRGCHQEARAYAYGGSVMPDMGYYPFGSHFFTNLLHYTRSGDFVEPLIRDARDVNEYAFALGALAHYVADSTGHPLRHQSRGADRVSEAARELRRRVTYIEDPTRHIMVEFAFDVVHVAERRLPAAGLSRLHRLQGREPI